MRRRSGSRVAVISVLLLGVIIFGLMYYIWNTATDIFQPASSNSQAQPIPFEISRGETTAQIADNLQAKGLIRNALAFRVWARIKGLDTHLEAGIYKKLTPGMTISQVIDQLLDAQPDAIRIVFPEGWRLEQIRPLSYSKAGACGLYHHGGTTLPGKLRSARRWYCARCRKFDVKDYE